MQQNKEDTQRYVTFHLENKKMFKEPVMKNIQVIDGAVNCVYDIFQSTEDEFSKIFPLGQDIAFIDEVYANSSSEELDKVFSKIWQRRIAKINANGIHGILFYELDNKKQYYPDRKDETAINPTGSRLR
jgi:hypothetical protein